MELWFLFGQGFHDHLEKDVSEISLENSIKLSTKIWIFNFVIYCGNRWNPKYWEPFKLAQLFGRRLMIYFANDIQCLYDLVHKLASLK